MEDRRSDEPGRREEDRRWLKVQEQIMNLVTSQRTSQQETSKIEIELTKLADHIDDLDDHLRGVAGHESIDTRVAVLERSTQEHIAILRKVDRKLDDLKKQSDEVRADVSAIKLHRLIEGDHEKTKTERLKVWFTFWGPIVIATIALIVPLATLTVNHWDTISGLFKREDFVARYAEKKRPRRTVYKYRIVAPKKDEPPKVVTPE